VDSRITQARVTRMRNQRPRRPEPRAARARAREIHPAKRGCHGSHDCELDDAGDLDERGSLESPPSNRVRALARLSKSSLVRSLSRPPRQRGGHRPQFAATLAFLWSASADTPNHAGSRHVDAKFAHSPPPEPAPRALRFTQRSVGATGAANASWRCRRFR